MRSLTLISATAALALAAPALRSAQLGTHGEVILAQSMTGGAGSNSAAGVGSGPNTEAAPGPKEGSSAADRTSKDSGTSNPFAGDEQDSKRPSTDPRPGGGMPHPSPGAR